LDLKEGRGTRTTNNKTETKKTCKSNLIAIVSKFSFGKTNENEDGLVEHIRISEIKNFHFVSDTHTKFVVSPSLTSLPSLFVSLSVVILFLSFYLFGVLKDQIFLIL
jgi:hypothetical protein